MPLPTGAAGTAAAAQAVVTALAALEANDHPSAGSTYLACFPTTAGVSRDTTITDGPNGPLQTPLAVTCRTDLAVTDTQAWRLSLTISWPGTASYAAGSLVQDVLIGADGTSLGSTIEGQLPGAP